MSSLSTPAEDLELVMVVAVSLENSMSTGLSDGLYLCSSESSR